LTAEEITVFFKAITDLRDRALFRVIYHRGLRAHEPGRLRLTDFQNREGKLHVTRGKGSAGGQFRLVDEELRALRAYIRYKRGTAPGPLFLSRNGRALGRWQIWSLMRRYCATAGIDPAKAHPHALKHSCGTHLAELGEDLLDIQDHLGHRNIANTKRYVEITSKRRDATAERLRDWR
jgi:site-specific recombinase XerD